MTQHATVRQPWVRHDSVSIESAIGRLPRLWQVLSVSELSQSGPQAASSSSAELAARITEIEQRATAEHEAAQAEIAYWRDHARAVEADARAKGHAEGFAAGELEGRLAGEAAALEAARPAIERLQQLVAGSVTDLSSALRFTRDRLVDLSLEIASAIIGEAFAFDRTLLARRVATLLDRMAESVTTTVRVHPGDLPQLKEAWHALARERSRNSDAPRFVASDAISPGGCVIETRTQLLDGQIETLSALVREAFDRASESEDASLAPPAEIHLEEAA